MIKLSFLFWEHDLIIIIIEVQSTLTKTFTGKNKSKKSHTIKRALDKYVFYLYLFILHIYIPLNFIRDESQIKKIKTSMEPST